MWIDSIAISERVSSNEKGFFYTRKKKTLGTCIRQIIIEEYPFKLLNSYMHCNRYDSCKNPGPIRSQTFIHFSLNRNYSNSRYLDISLGVTDSRDMVDRWVGVDATSGTTTLITVESCRGTRVGCVMSSKTVLGSWKVGRLVVTGKTR